ncbi:protein TUB21 [Cinnamomum micranthum f. kanehirae]|uniref:Protein TUB21 n=1 Tax=Cinnamomum micranthum f. kanehirae TaxID=337451 RepID=A0A3S3MA29_9MAGN|nr:protein TUB21 [Cinnamomum micranthum f. kanehirae]
MLLCLTYPRPLLPHPHNHPLIIRCCILVLLYSDTKSFNIALSLSELHLIHPLSCVPMAKKAFLLNIAVNCSDTLRNISWIEVELPMKVDAMESPLGGMSQTLDFHIVGNPFNKVG